MYRYKKWPTYDLLKSVGNSSVGISILLQSRVWRLRNEMGTLLCHKKKISWDIPNHLYRDETGFIVHIQFSILMIRPRNVFSNRIQQMHLIVSFHRYKEANPLFGDLFMEQIKWPSRHVPAQMNDSQGHWPSVIDQCLKSAIGGTHFLGHTPSQCSLRWTVGYTARNCGKYSSIKQSNHRSAERMSSAITSPCCRCMIKEKIQAGNSATSEVRDPFQYPMRRLIVRSREVSKPWDW